MPNFDGTAATNLLDPVNPQDGATKHYVDIFSLFSRLFIAGHSWAAGGGADPVDRSWYNVLGAMLRSVVVNVAKGGAVLSWNDDTAMDTGTGGWVTLIQGLKPGGYAPLGGVKWKGAWVASTLYASYDGVWVGTNWYICKATAPKGLTSRGAWVTTNSYAIGDYTTNGGATWRALVAVAANAAAPVEGTTWTQIDPGNTAYWGPITGPSSPGASKYLPLNHFPVLFYGTNDLGWDKNLALFQQSLRYAICATLCAQIYQTSDPTIVLGGTAALAATSGSASYSWPNIIAMQHVGDSVTISVPPDFAGGEIDLGFILSGSGGILGVASVTVDGTAVTGSPINFATLPVSPTASAKVNPYVFRIQGLAAGPHTIVITATTAMGNCYFDWWGIQSNPVGLGAFIGLPKVINYQTWSSPYPTDADVATWNTALAAMMGTPSSEFPTYHFIDLANVIETTDSNLFIYDNVHPNRLGHAKLAASIYTQLLSITATPEQIAYQSKSERLDTVASIRFIGGDFPCANDGVWREVTDGSGFVEVTVVAAPGDVIVANICGSWGNNAGAGYGYSDLEIIYNGVANGNTFVNGGPGTLAGESISLSAAQPATIAPLLNGPAPYVVRPEDCYLGTVTVRLAVKTQFGSGASTVTRSVYKNTPANSSVPLFFTLKNESRPATYRGPNFALV